MTAPTEPASAPPWTAPLADALRRARAHAIARYAQLATVDATGAPRCRTVVIRALLPEHGAVLFTTDARSAKVGQLVHDPRAEVCWYFAGLREQFRLAGAVVLARDGDGDAPAWLARDAGWLALSPAARASFLGPPPGTAREARDVFPRETHAPAPPASFVAVALVADAVEHLQLRATPHERVAYAARHGVWSATRLRP